eukprot:4535430-Amphidinium_carterae.1
MARVESCRIRLSLLSCGQPAHSAQPLCISAAGSDFASGGRSTNHLLKLIILLHPLSSLLLQHIITSQFQSFVTIVGLAQGPLPLKQKSLPPENYVTCHHVGLAIQPLKTDTYRMMQIATARRRKNSLYPAHKNENATGLDANMQPSV